MDQLFADLAATLDLSAPDESGRILVGAGPWVMGAVYESEPGRWAAQGRADWSTIPGRWRTTAEAALALYLWAARTDN